MSTGADPVVGGAERSELVQKTKEKVNAMAPTAAQIKPAMGTAWNTTNLGLRLAADGAAAATAGVLVAPIITVIDKYVILSAPSSNATSVRPEARNTTTSTIF